MLFGLATRTDDRLHQYYELIRTILWWSTGAATLLLTLHHTPAALARASQISKEYEQEADRTADSDPAQSLRMYRKAISITPARQHELEIRAKIRNLPPELVHSIDDAAAVDKTRAGAEVEDGAAPVRRRSNRASRSAPKAIGPRGRYKLQQQLGQGGMGFVYQGVDSVLDRPIAIKGLPEELCQDEQVVSRFHQEARALAFLSHPCIVQVYDLVDEGHRLWIILELVAGGDLAAHLATQGRLPLAEAARFGCHLAGALHYAHSQGIVHRDFKPSNVLLTSEHNPKITDFGLARLLGAGSLTHSGTILGSPKYMSPEQAEGKPAEEEADAYAFGITLYELLTGRAPFDGDIASVLAQHITKLPDPPARHVPDIPEQINKLVLRLLEKDPARRESDLDAVSRTLSDFADVTGTPSRQIPASQGAR